MAVMTNTLSVRLSHITIASALVVGVVAGSIAPAAALGITAADDYALSRLGPDYGSASFRHHFYRNVPNKGLSRADHEVFLDAKRTWSEGF